MRSQTEIMKCTHTPARGFPISKTEGTSAILTIAFKQ